MVRTFLIVVNAEEGVDLSDYIDALEQATVDASGHARILGDCDILIEEVPNSVETGVVLDGKRVSRMQVNRTLGGSGDTEETEGPDVDWDDLIQEAERQLKAMKRSLRFFKEQKHFGEPFPVKVKKVSDALMQVVES